MPTLTCSLDRCDNTFYCRPARIKKNKTGNICCSTKCRDLIRRERIIINCDNCSKELERCESSIFNTNFCSLKCHGEFITKQSLITLICDNCNNSFKKRKSLYMYQKTKRDHKHVFCSRSCYEEYENMYPNTYHIRSRIISRRMQTKYREELHPSYVRELIYQQIGNRELDVPKQAINLKRKTLILKRNHYEKSKGST